MNCAAYGSSDCLAVDVFCGVIHRNAAGVELGNEVFMPAATADNESAVVGDVGLMFVCNANC